VNIDHAPTFPMHADEGSNATALAAIIRGMMFTFPQRRLSRALATSDYSVHSYRFAPPLHTLLGLLFGDCHCIALPFIFSKADAAGRTSGDVAAAASIEKLTGSAWVASAAGRAPASPWSSFDAASAFPSLIIDGGSEARLVNYLWCCRVRAVEHRALLVC